MAGSKLPVPLKRHNTRAAIAAAGTSASAAPGTNEVPATATAGADPVPGPEKGETAHSVTGSTAVATAASAAPTKKGAQGDTPAQPPTRANPPTRAPQPESSLSPPSSLEVDDRGLPGGNGGGRANRAPSSASGSDSSFEGMYLDPLSMRDPDQGFRVEENVRVQPRGSAVASESDVTPSSETRTPSETPAIVKSEPRSSALPRGSSNSTAPCGGTADTDRELEGHIIQAYQEFYRVREETDAEIEAAIRRLQRTQNDAQRRYQRIGDVLNQVRRRTGIDTPPYERVSASVPQEDKNIEAAVRELRGLRREDENSEDYGRRVAAREREERERVANRAPRVEWRHALTSEERLRNAGFAVGESASQPR